jgi:hypothetical protein
VASRHTNNTDFKIALSLTQRVAIIGFANQQGTLEVVDLSELPKVSVKHGIYRYLRQD